MATRNELKSRLNFGGERWPALLRVLEEFFDTTSGHSHDGTDSRGVSLSGAGLTATADEINGVCDGNTATAVEITRVCDGAGVGTTAAALNALVTAGTRSVVTFNAHEFTVAAAEASYRVELDFSADGEFGDVAYVAVAAGDGDGVIVQPDTGRQTTGKTAFIVSVAAAAADGTYGGPLDVSLSVTLAGVGWTGETTGPFDGNWTEPAAI